MIFTKLLYYLFEKANNYTRKMQHGKVTVTGFVKGIKQVQFEGNNGVSRNCNFNGSIKFGRYTTIGYNGTIHGTITIGKYCQIGPDVAIIATNHPNTFLTSYINKQLFNGQLMKNKEEAEIIIGNDVWIGQHTTILSGVTIGNGAIIAAGAVVTKDVAPYSIVGGVPAKEIKKRFSDSVINEIKLLKWWDKSESELEKLKPLFFKDFTKNKSIYE